ncbi:MAG: hypothetical protein ACOVQE_00980 [Chitinophagaceae bacterium]
MKKIVMAITALVLFSIACKHQMVDPATLIEPITVTPPVTNPTVNDTVCFQTQVLPLYQSYCASSGCHDAVSRKDGVITTDYFNIMKGIKAKNPSSSKYYTIITKGEMPPSGSPKLNADQIALIAKWINQGALNTVCNSNTCDTSKYTYTNSISATFATYCNGCHTGANASAGIILSDYTNAKSVAVRMKANFLSAINYTAVPASKNMPPAGKLATCQIDIITKWINAGMPQ